MKIKRYKDILEQDNVVVTADIKKKARLEARALRNLQLTIKKALASYMKKNKVGFNEMVRRLHSTADHVSRMQRGEANLTLASIAHLAALLEHDPVLTFQER